MRTCLPCLLVIFLGALTTTAAAISPIMGPSPHPGNLHPPSGRARADTIWFGGLDPNRPGYAREGGVWDFDDGTLQGWTSIDMSTNPDIYFGWVTLGDFAEDEFPPDAYPYAPMLDNTTGMIWCGIHTADAEALDYVNGLGYGNHWWQRALSPKFDFDPAARIDLQFDFFAYSEAGYDLTYIRLLPYAAGSGEDSLMTDAILELAAYGGEEGDYTQPAFGDFRTRAYDLPAASIRFQIEILFRSDIGFSDQDGWIDCPFGPCAFDNIRVWTEDDPPSVDALYDFDDGPQGWVFEKKPGAGTFSHLVNEMGYGDWMYHGSGLHCGCGLSDQAVCFNSIVCDDGYPGVLPGVWEAFTSPVVDRTLYPFPQWYDVVFAFDAYENLPKANGCLIRLSCKYYPYMGDHWSPPYGNVVWWFREVPHCTRLTYSASRMNFPPPADWDSLKFIYEIMSSCDEFGVPPDECLTPGCGKGSPVIDNVRVGIVGAGVDAPVCQPWIGSHLFMDGFGQHYPTYLEPSDVGCANIAADLAWDHPPEANRWMADTSVIVGPPVLDEDSRWLAELCFRIATKGPRQDWIPGYHSWKSRLAEDPEDGFVCVLMDTAQSTPTADPEFPNWFASYFHEEHPGFDPTFSDYTEAQEIFPDDVFVPGTSVEYYWRSYWYRGGMPPEDYYVYPPSGQPLEFTILPMMEADPENEYRVRWPSALYIDAFNGGAEPYMMPAFEQEGIAVDRFDYLIPCNSTHAPMKRRFGGTSFNPGGWSNNGCTTEQLQGYRLIFLNTGYLGAACMHPDDFDMFAQWIECTDCGLASIRRAFIFDGAGVCYHMADPQEGCAHHLAFDLLGIELENSAYREANDDTAHCAGIEPTDGSVFAPDAPVRVWSSGCPWEIDYNVIGLFPTGGAVGNARWFSYQGTGNDDFVDFAQVVKDHQPGANLRTVVNGFNFFNLSKIGCEGSVGSPDCRRDSVCIVEGAAAMIRPVLGWVEDESDPFIKWLYPCVHTGVDEDDVPHVTGPVSFLYDSRPNPFNSRATIRLSLAHAGHLDLGIFDVTGRRVRTLVDGEREGGEHSVVWDGTDNQGRRLGAGIYWVQMKTDDGYRSGKKLLILN